MINVKRKTNNLVEENKRAKKKSCGKMILSVVISVALMLALMPQRVFGDTNHTEDDGNWTIYNAQGMVELRDAINGGNNFRDKKITLANDIDLSSVCSEENPWEPIGVFTAWGGNGYTKFYGTFDGAGNKISNLYLNGENDNTGLFGFIGGSNTFTNLTLENVKCRKGNGKFIGGICGQAYNGGNYSNCAVSGNLQGGDCVGGILGAYDNCNDYVIENSSFTGEIYGAERVGGIYGGDADDRVQRGILKQCSCKGNIHGTKNVGGVSGRLQEAHDCFFEGTVECTGDYVGGIAGNVDKATKCVSKGNITGNNGVGGLVGSYKSSLKECFSEANANGKIYVGGLSGCADVSYGGNANLDISNCYATGNVTGGSEIGGILGSAPSTSSKVTISCCYFSGNINGTGYTYGNGKTLCYLGGIMGYDAVCVCERCVCLAPEIRGTGDPDIDVVAYISAAYLNDRPGSNLSGYSSIATGDDIRCFYRADLANAYGVGYDGAPYDIKPGWQSLFKYADLAAFDYQSWLYPNIDLDSLAYSVATLPILKNLNVDQSPKLRYANDFYYLCKAEDINLVPDDVSRFDLGDGYYRLWMNEDYYDYKKGAQLKTFTSTNTTRPFMGWTEKNDPSATISEIPPAEEYSVKEIVASFGTDSERIFESQLENETFVRVVDRFNQIPATWRLVVELVNGNLQEHGLDENILEETEHGQLYQIYFADENDNKVEPLNLENLVEVWVPVPDGYDIEDLKMYYLIQNADDTEHKILRIENESNHNYAVFETNHFSPYTLIDILNDQEKAERAKSKNPPTNDEFYTFGSIILSGMFAGALFVMFTKFYSSRKKKSE